MRILHLNNTAGTSVTFRDAQISLGQEALVAQTFRGALPMNWREDYRFFGDVDLLGKAAFALQLVHLVRWADVVHVHGYFPPKGLRFIAWFRRPMVLHFVGTEVRTGRWKAMAPFGDAILLSTPDLKRGCPGGSYLPNPLAPHGITADPRPDFRIVNAHAGHASAAKGTDRIREAVNTVLQEEPGAEFVEVTNTPHDVALRIYASCDLAVDQLVVGWYGLFATECMSMGIPTLGYVDRSIEEPNPVYPVNDELEDTIRRFIHDTEFRRSVGRRQRKFVLAQHDPIRLARRTLALYESLLEDR